MLYSVDETCIVERFERQPLPDYLIWIDTSDLHYLSIERLKLNIGVWGEISGLFIPTKILDLCMKVLPNPPADIVYLVAILAWVLPDKVKEYYKKVEKQMEETIENDRNREQWKEHSLYKQHTKESICRKSRITVTSSLAKHTLVKLISESK